MTRLRIIGLLCAALLATVPAQAAPPPPGSEDAGIMGDFADWVRGQHTDEGRWCCDISDGRPLHENEIRRHDGETDIFVSRTHWADAPEPGVWLRVPDTARLHTENPIGLPMAWVMGDRVYCFIEGNGS